MIKHLILPARAGRAVGCCCACPRTPRCACSPASPSGARWRRSSAAALVEVSVATSALQDPHQIQAKPSLIARARNADLVVCTGAELEIGWLPVLLQQSGNAQGAAGPAGQLRRGRLRAQARRARLSSTARRATCTRPATRTSRPIRATSRWSPPRSARACSRSIPRTRPSTRRRQASFTQRWQQAMRALDRAGSAAEGRRGRVAAQGLRLSLRLARPEGGGRARAQARASSRRRRTCRTVLSTLKATPARMVLYAAYQDPRPSDWLSQERRHPRGEAALHRRRHRRREGPVRAVRRHRRAPLAAGAKP